MLILVILKNLIMGKAIKVTEDEILRMVELYETGNYSYRQIGKIMNRGDTIVGKILKNLNYPTLNFRNRNIKYTINHNFFENINTEEKAYFLGLMYADGNVSSKYNSIRISLVEADSYLLEALRDLISPTHILYKRNYDVGNNQRSLEINSIKIKNDLIKLGCPPNKTFTITFPNSSIVPEELIHHFIRGYFDGDGCSYKNTITFVGTKSFLLGIQGVLHKYLGFKMRNMPSRSANGIIKALGYGGSHQMIAFRNWLYKDATIYMTRKMDKLYSVVALPKFILPNIKPHEETCSIEGCCEIYYSKDLCRKHYRKYSYQLSKSIKNEYNIINNSRLHGICCRKSA